MYPVQSPHQVRGEVKRALLVPILIDVVAKFLYPIRNFKSSGRLVPATPDFNFGWSPIASIVRDPRESRTMKVEQV
jgi:hypothetical protein